MISDNPCRRWPVLVTLNWQVSKAIKVKKLHLVRIRISVEFLGEFVNHFFPPFEFFPMISLTF